MIELLVPPIIALIAVIIRWLAGLRVQDIERHAHFMDAFFDASESLVEDHDTPDVLLRILNFVGENLRDRWLMRRLFIDALGGRVRQIAKYSRNSEFHRAMQQLPHYLQHDAARAMQAGLLAMTFNNVFIGRILRRMMLYSLSDQDAVGSDAEDNRAVTPIMQDLAARHMELA